MAKTNGVLLLICVPTKRLHTDTENSTYCELHRTLLGKQRSVQPSATLQSTLFNGEYCICRRVAHGKDNKGGKRADILRFASAFFQTILCELDAHFIIAKCIFFIPDFHKINCTEKMKSFISYTACLSINRDFNPVVSFYQINLLQASLIHFINSVNNNIACR
jgi:hypothetical protein